MKRFVQLLVVSAGLTSLTMSVVFAACSLGLVPDETTAIWERRKDLCESLAIYCSVAVQRGDVPAMKAAARTIIERHPEVASAAIRGADGEILVEIGEPDYPWDLTANDPSTPAPVHVPIAVQDRRWGTVEVLFKPVLSSGSWYGGPVARLVSFVAAAAFIAHFAYLFLVMKRLSRSNAVPQRVQATLDTLAEGVLILDKDRRIALANEAFSKMVRQTAADLTGRNAFELPWTPAAQGCPPTEFPWERSIHEGVSQKGAMLGLQNGASNSRTLKTNSMPIVGDDGARRGALVTFDDLSPIEEKNEELSLLLKKYEHSRAELRRKNRQLETLASCDPLTSCLNRRAFFSELESLWGNAKRHAQPLSCVMVDVDHFKSVNDRHGHAAGDLALQQVAQVLKASTDSDERVCRYGGEEFCVLLPGLDVREATEKAERYRAAIASAQNGGMALSASLGVSSTSLGAAEPRQLIDEADKALYAAKRGGRNRVVCWGEIPPERKDDGALDKRDAVGAGVPIPFQAVAALVSSLAYRHADTAEHSRRVADLCAATARGLLSPSQCYVLEVAALLHDIGKLGIPDAVLLKPGPLTEEEWKVIRTHSMIGEEIISASFNSAELTAIIRNHHAWYGGHPDCSDLPTGEHIALGARLLAIADAFDAMTSDRLYRKGRSHTEAFRELRRCAGTQFDPVLVDRFIDVVSARNGLSVYAELPMPKQTALRIGFQIEKLANALDTQDIDALATLAGHLRAIAGEHEITQIAEAAAELEMAAKRRASWLNLIQLTTVLLDLCRSTYSSYLPDMMLESDDQPERDFFNWKAALLMNEQSPLERQNARLSKILLDTTLSKELAENSKERLRAANLELVREIDDRKRAEETLRELEERFEAFMDNSPAVAFMKDADGRYLYVNRTFLVAFHLERDKTLGRMDTELWPPEIARNLREHDDKARSANRTLEFVETMPAPDGAARDWLVYKFPLQDAHQQRLLAGIALDVTEKKCLEAQFLQAQKMEAVGRLAGGVAHDFNNLLTVIIGYSHFLLQRPELGVQDHEMAGEIHKAGERAAALTRQLLAFSRKQIIKPEIVDLNGTIHDLRKMLSRLIGEDIELVFVAAASLWRVKTDPGQVEQVLMNLAVNARDAMPSGGKLTIESANIVLDEAFQRTHRGSRIGEYVMLSVMDTGCGMSAEIKAHIFEPFFTTKEQGKGTGLGLATIYGIVKQNNGYIEVISEPGRGTMFKIFLPRVEEDLSPHEQRLSFDQASSGKETILVAEDEDALRAIVCLALRQHGYTILAARNGVEAMRICEQEEGPIHLLLTDMVMPQMGGRELADRATALRPRLKVVYMSGYTEGAVSHAGVLEDGKAFLQKPFSPETLARKIREAIGAIG